MIREFTIYDCPQRSPEWFAARAGLVTGSKAKVVFMKADTAGRDEYMLQLALERLTKKVEPEPFVSAEMRHGIEKEPWCRLATEIQYGVTVRQTGFCRHNKLAIGMSFDGDIDDFTTFTEFKAPKNAKFVMVRGIREAFKPGTEPKVAISAGAYRPSEGPQPYNQVWPDGQPTGAPPPPAPAKKQDDMSGLY